MRLDMFSAVLHHEAMRGFDHGFGVIGLTVLATAFAVLLTAGVPIVRTPDAVKISDWLGFAGNVVGAGATLAAAYIAWRAVQSQIALQQVAIRPWVAAPSIELERSGDDVVCTLTFNNVGQMPTTGLYIDAKIVSGRTEASDDAYRQILAGRRTTKMPFFRATTLIPRSNLLVQSTKSEQHLNRVSVQRLRDLEDPIIAGCVLYGSPFDDIIHESIFMIGITISGDVVSSGIAYTYNAN